MAKSPVKIEYKTGIVTFMDILGWREWLKRNDASELALALEVFRMEANPVADMGFPPDNDDGWKSMYEYAVLSDCVFRCTETEHKYNKECPHGQLFYELSGLISVQTRLIHLGYLIRGAVTYGKYYGSRDANGQALFGPAIAAAYEMETKLAIYPRIVIDPALIEEFFKNKYLRNEVNSVHEEWSEYVSGYLLRDENGVWFVDYLLGYFQWTGDGKSSCYLFEYHKLLINTELSKLSKTLHPADGVANKILWLFRYHNASMNRITDSDWAAMKDGDFEAKRDDFLIDTPDIPLFKQFGKA